MKTLAEVMGEIERLAAVIGVPAHLLPTYDRPRGDATPLVEVDEREYHYVISERGSEIRRLTTDNLERALYAVFRGATFSMACDYELEHRVDNRDFRRVLFAKQIELLTKLSPEWGERMEREKEKILKLFPFDDGLDARMEFANQLRQSGETTESAWRIACVQYPQPRRGSEADSARLHHHLEEEW